MKTHRAPSLRLGVHKRKITPSEPIHMSGYGARQERSTGVHSDLFLRVFALENLESDGTTRRALIATADMITWDPEEVAKIRRVLAEKFSVAPEAVILNASHSHSGPTCHRVGHLLIRPGDDRYCLELTGWLLEAAERAFDDLEPVSLHRGSKPCTGLAIHRRVMVDGQVEMLPNPSGPRDDLLTVLQFRRADGSDRTPKAALVHWTCHPTIMGGLLLSSEFPGFAMEQLEAEAGGAMVCGFLQGCSGDIRPNHVNAEGRFIPGEGDAVARFGQQLAETAKAVFESGLEPVEPGPFRYAEQSVALPFQAVPSKEEFAALASDPLPHQQLRAETFSNWPGAIPTEAVLKVQALVIAQGCGFIAMDGEIVVAYSHFIRQIGGNRYLPLGYSNGLIGYVPTDAQIVEGGYEGDRSQVYFMKPTPYAVGIEGAIHRTIEAVMAAVEGNEGDGGCPPPPWGVI